MDFIKNLLSLGFLKGSRTNIIVILVVALYGVELFVDIPGVNITWEMVLIALGVKTAAEHEPTFPPPNRG